MKKRLDRIHSPQLGRGLSLWSYGHWGVPLVVFPTAAGFAHEWEAQGMVEALAPWIEARPAQALLPGVERRRGVDAQARTTRPSGSSATTCTSDGWSRPWRRRSARSAARPTIPLLAAGASLGAFYSANVALKYPDVFRWSLCMSGRYAMTHFTDGFSNLDVYFNNPLAYVGGLSGEPLERVKRNTHIVLVCGQGAYEEGCIEETAGARRPVRGEGDPPRPRHLGARLRPPVGLVEAPGAVPPDAEARPGGLSRSGGSTSSRIESRENEAALRSAGAGGPGSARGERRGG